MDRRVDDDFSLQARYDQLWEAAHERIRTGEVEIDPVLARQEADRRRGLTLLFRPSAPTRRCLEEFLDDLRVLEPAQHYYQGGEMHVTFLSLFTATVEPAALERTADYEAAVRAVAAELPSFHIHFRGVTASAGAIMVQGQVEARTLNAARDRLRRELIARGLAESVDARYRLETAHLTVVRFRAPLRDSRLFAEMLADARQRDFGADEITALHLTKSDWYQSRAATEDLLRCDLRPRSPHFCNGPGALEAESKSLLKKGQGCE